MRKEKLWRWLLSGWAQFGPGVATGIVCIVLALVAPDFATAENWQNLLRQMSFNTIVSVGMTMVIITAGIDLSVGSVMALCECVLAHIAVKLDKGLLIGVPAGLAVALLCGLINGSLVAFVRLPPFIASLGMMSIARGLALVLTGGFSISLLQAEGIDLFHWLGDGLLVERLPVPLVGYFPMPVLIAGAVVVFGYTMLTYTRFGRYVYAIGGNEEAARLSGVNVVGVKLTVYCICSTLAGLSGVLLSGRVRSVRPTDGQMWELDAIAAVVIGGTSLMGGRGSVIGTLFGAALIAILRNGLVLLRVSAFWQQVVIGCVIILAVMFDRLVRKR
ncbi:MAG: ABC transporter permease [Armatimonadota bacterium]|nr:ABC transporter permease [Armatimonadota bacterium]MDW8025291.1 ABC transporter permease [Armatimonadota bacterium]